MKCPIDQEEVSLICLVLPNNNIPVGVRCRQGVSEGRCPKGGKYICEFQLSDWYEEVYFE